MRWLWWMNRRLHERGVLGLNARSARYMLPHNDRQYYPLVDDKTITKNIFLEHGLPVPPLYAVLRSVGELRDLDERLAAHRSLVVKPARGSGGRGVLVVAEHGQSGWVTASGDVLAREEVRCWWPASAIWWA